VASPDNPEPCSHALTGDAGDRMATPGLHFAMDSLAMNVHGNADSHLDALCHVIYDGALYNGVHPGTVTPGEGTVLSIDVVRDGIVGRGVLLDIPRVRGVSWLEPGDCVTAADLEAAERAQHVRIRTGDLLFVRVGHRRRRDELGAWDAAQARAGLHPTAVPLLAERGIAALIKAATHTARHPISAPTVTGAPRPGRAASADPRSPRSTWPAGWPRRSGTCSPPTDPSPRQAPRSLWPRRGPPN
jgi:kynurenine formamidase